MGKDEQAKSSPTLFMGYCKQFISGTTILFQMFIDEKMKNIIHVGLNASVSHGTMRRQDLIPTFMEVLKETPEYVQLMQLVPCHALENEYAEWWNSEDAIRLLESLFDTLNDYAPEGYYFGAYPGDESDYGFWKITD